MHPEAWGACREHGGTQCHWRDVAAIALIAALVRLAYAAAVPFPPADDPAYYATVARNLAAGRGFVSDVIWQYNIIFAQPTHPAGELWMPLPSFAMAICLRLFGNGWLSAQIPGIAAGSALAALSYGIAREALRGDAWARVGAWCSALLVALNGVLSYQSVSGDSSSLFSVLVAAALLLAGRALSPSDSGAAPATFVARGLTAGTAVGAGAALGLAYLTRSDVLLIVPALAWIALRSNAGAGGRKARAWWLGITFAAASAVVLPWLARNLVEFGTPFPMPAARLALLTTYDALFDFPAAMTAGLPDMSEMISLRLQALWFSWQNVLGFLFFPTALIPVAGLVVAHHRPGVRLAGVAGISIFLGTALVFPVPTLAGTSYHDAGAFAPWLALGTVVLARCCMSLASERRGWKSDLFWIPYLALLALTIAQLGMTAVAVRRQHSGEEEFARSAGAWLESRGAAVVISNAPYNLDYVARQPGLKLPAAQRPEAVHELARRYGASVLVVIGSEGLYPKALSDAPICGKDDIADQPFCLAHSAPGWKAYEIN